MTLEFKINLDTIPCVLSLEFHITDHFLCCFFNNSVSKERYIINNAIIANVK